MKKVFIAFALIIAAGVRADSTSASVWNFKREFIDELAQSVPTTLQRQNARTGRFGPENWLPLDQLPIYPLAAVWATRDAQNKFYHDTNLLNAIMSGGDALITAQDKTGRWEFRKRDNSTWGMHYDPWVYSRWVRTYSLIRDAMPPRRRERWRKALELGYSGIAAHELTHVQNIPTHQAMGLYVAGKALNHPQWCEQAAAFLIRVAQAQDTNGFWTEHCGPVVHYNTVYVDALGTYYALSHDRRVLEALERSARFQANFTYPDGSYVETVDERNPYLDRTEPLNVGFSYCSEGRTYLRDLRNIARERGVTPNTDALASMVLYGEEGAIDALPKNRVFVTGDGKAKVIRQDNWCAVLSAYACPLSQSRWIQDRQNFVSLFNDKTGVVLGGGNTKLQPLWSTFTIGDTTLLKHRAGDERPNFAAPKGLLHIPTSATLDTEENLLRLNYGDAQCGVRLDLLDAQTARLTYSVTHAGSLQPIEAHVTLLPSVNRGWRAASGRSGQLTSSALSLSATDVGDWFEHNGSRISIPRNATLRWPVLPHNPYRKDGHADASEGRIVLTLPFSENIKTQTVLLTLTK